MHITSDSYMIRFFKRLYLRCLGVGESIGAARAAQQLFSLNYREEAQAVINNYVRAARARDRLISQLEDTK
jgi:hypothetical protein